MENWQTFLGNPNFPLISNTFDGMTYYKLLSQLYEYTSEEKQDTLTFDTYPVEDSTNPVTSGGVYDAIAAGGGVVNIDNELSETSINAVQNAVITAALAEKEDTLTWDSTPTDSSTNPVTSGGIYTALSEKLDAIDIEQWPSSATSTNLITSGGVYSYGLTIKSNTMSEFRDTYTDVTPTEDSDNYVTSGGVYAAIQDAIDALREELGG